MGKLVVTVPSLKRAHDLLKPVITKNHTLFGCVKLSWGNTNLAVLSGTDLQAAGHISLDVVVNDLPKGEILFPFRLLAALAKIKADCVNIEKKTGRIAVEWLTKTGVVGKRWSRTENLDRYPDLSTSFKVTTPAHFEDFGKYLYEANGFTGNEAARFVLNAIKTSKTGIIATDGRIGYRAKGLTHLPESLFILPKWPKKYVHEITGMTENETHVCLIAPRWTCVIRKTEGSFPDMDRVIPNSFKISKTFDNEKLLDALKTISDSVDKEKPCVVFEIHKNGIAFETKTSGDSMRVEIDTMDDDPYRMGFNPYYLKQILELGADRFYANNADSCSVFRRGDIEMALMPILIE